MNVSWFTDQKHSKKRKKERRHTRSITTGSARYPRRSCQDQPPRVAFPIRPCLPLLPQEVDPDAWLAHLHGRASLRHSDTGGNVKGDEQSYSVDRERRGHSVARLFDAPAHQFQVS